MTATERRHPENAKLREKIKHIQQAGQQLQSLAAQVQVQTVSWAREGKVVDLPNAELARHLSVSFQQQRAALAQIQDEIKGVSARKMAPAALITQDELTALMK
jgi:hypothetical protein